MKAILRSVCTVLALAASVNALAQAWPARPVRLIVSQAAGTSPDIAARLIAERMSRQLGQSLLVENRAGGQNVIGAQAAARAAPDGYTFFFATTAAIVTNPLTFKALPYDPPRDFDAVGMIAKSPMVVAVGAGVPVKSLAELIALDKSKPNTLSAAHEGPRTFSGMMSQALNLITGMQVLQVPYNGATPAIQDTIGGRTQIVLLSSAAVAPFIKRGDLRPLAVTVARRVAGLENVPALAETYPGFDYAGWFALLAPAGTPREVVLRVNRELNSVLAEPDVAQRLRDLGLVLEPGTPEALNEFLGAERARWSRLVKEIGLQPE